MIRICELSPRDGIQVFKRFIPSETKIELINSLSESGLKEIHVTYFAHPKAIPQMKDADYVAQKIKRSDDVTYIGFVPNEVGLRRAIHSKLDRISFFISAEESINQAFFRKTTNSLLDDFVTLTREAKLEGIDAEVFIVRAIEKENWGLACSIAEKLIKAGTSIVYFSNFGAPINTEDMKDFFKNLGSYITSVDIGIHIYAPDDSIENIIIHALNCDIKRFATSIGGLGLRRIDGNLVMLPPTELVANLAGIKGLKLDRPMRIVKKIKELVEEIGTL